MFVAHTHKQTMTRERRGRRNDERINNFIEKGSILWRVLKGWIKSDQKKRKIFFKLRKFYELTKLNVGYKERERHKHTKWESISAIYVTILPHHCKRKIIISNPEEKERESATLENEKEKKLWRYQYGRTERINQEREREINSMLIICGSSSKLKRTYQPISDVTVAHSSVIRINHLKEKDRWEMLLRHWSYIYITLKKN